MGERATRKKEERGFGTDAERFFKFFCSLGVLRVCVYRANERRRRWRRIYVCVWADRSVVVVVGFRSSFRTTESRKYLPVVFRKTFPFPFFVAISPMVSFGCGFRGRRAKQSSHHRHRNAHRHSRHTVPTFSSSPSREPIPFLVPRLREWYPRSSSHLHRPDRQTTNYYYILWAKTTEHEPSLSSSSSSSTSCRQRAFTARWPDVRARTSCCAPGWPRSWPPPA